MIFSMSDFGNSPPEGLLKEVLEEAEGCLDEKSCGVIRQVLAQGAGNLSPKQNWTLENKVIPALTELCSSCSREVIAGQDYCSVCEIEYG